MDTGEENKVLLRRFVDEVINTGDVGLVPGFVGEDFVDHDPPWCFARHLWHRAGVHEGARILP
jgi:hypothetical protein